MRISSKLLKRAIGFPSPQSVAEDIADIFPEGNAINGGLACRVYNGPRAVCSVWWMGGYEIAVRVFHNGLDGWRSVSSPDYRNLGFRLPDL
jgi:hypothetical protein